MRKLDENYIAVAVEDLRLMLKHCTEEERKKIFDAILKGYCIHCGGPSPCHCQNDE